MKSQLNIEIFSTRLGSTERREYHFTTSSVMELLNTLVDILKEFSANRGKRKITLSLTCEKGKKS